MVPARVPIDVFISYAAADEAHKDMLRVHLSLLKREGRIRTWHAQRIDAGDERDVKLAAQIEAAHVILLLISADYLAADAQWHEMVRAVARHKAGNARVIPILLHACDRENAPFSSLRSLPANGKPVQMWNDKNEAWTSIVRDIRASIKEHTEKIIATIPRTAPMEARATPRTAPMEARATPRTAPMTAHHNGLGIRDEKHGRWNGSRALNPRVIPAIAASSFLAGIFIAALTARACG